MGTHDRKGIRDTGGDYLSGRGPGGWSDIQREGSRNAAREYNESQAEFAQPGQVDATARDAELHADAELKVMDDAGRTRRSHARK